MTFRFLLVGCILPMAVGGITYLLFRDTGMLMFRWLDVLGLMGPLHEVRAWAAPVRPHLPDWLLFSMPDGAWVFSCTAFFAWLWPDGPWWMRFGWIGLGTALAVGGELGQVVGLVPGTYDTMDLVAYLAATVLSLLLVRAWRARTPLPAPA